MHFEIDKIYTYCLLNINWKWHQKNFEFSIYVYYICE